MALMGRKSEEEKAAKAARKEQERAEAEERKRRQAIERARADFFDSPAGKARVAFGAGEQVFQYAHDVTSQQAIIVAMVGSRTGKQTSDPSEILNSVCDEGWELVNGSFVFVHEGSQSRDKFMSSGQNLAVKAQPSATTCSAAAKSTGARSETRGRRSWHSTLRWKRWRPRRRPRPRVHRPPEHSHWRREREAVASKCLHRPALLRVEPGGDRVSGARD
jgi:hypothetical protein